MKVEYVDKPHADLIDMARRQAIQSPCRSKRGAVLFDPNDGASVGRGFNATPYCEGTEDCKATCRKYAIHAEQAATLSADGDTRDMEMIHVKVIDGAVVTSPAGETTCSECAKIMSYAGVAAIWLYHADGWQRYPMADYVARSHQA